MIYAPHARGTGWMWAAACLVALATVGDSTSRAVAQSGSPKRLADYFGFLPLEIYKLDNRLTSLVVADLDGDKIDDIAVANNARSRIDLLLSTPGPSESEGESGYGSNKLPSDRRMRIQTIPVNKEVVSIQAADFNSDGRNDLAFYGTPAELLIFPNTGGGEFGSPRRISTGPAVESSSALAAGDLNRDGRADLALMTPDELVLLVQQPDGTLARPERLRHTANRPGVLKLIDIDGDGGDDIVMLAQESEPIHVKFSQPGGRLGPEERFKIDQPRAVAYHNVDGQPGAEILTIDSQSGRARVFKLEADVANDDESRGRLLYYPLPTGTTRGRNLTLGDLNADGRTDVLATDPANAQVIAFLQQGPGEGFAPGQPFPSLVGGSSARIADFNADGKGELVVLSEQERQIGHTLLVDGRLAFPTPLPLTAGDPVGLEVANIDPDPQPELLYVARQKLDGKDQFSLAALDPAPDGSWKPFRWADLESIKLDGLTGSPEAVRAVDVNRDGHLDFLLLDPYGPPVLLLGQDGGQAPKKSTARPGPLAGVKAPGLSLANFGDGPSLLVAQGGTFARLVALAPDGQWQVKDQFNSGRTAAQILGAAALDSDGNGQKEVALMDRTSKSLLFLDPEDGVYRPGPTLSVGTLDFIGLHVADLDADKKDDLLIAGTDKFGVVLTGGQGRQLRPIASYSPTRKDSRFADLIAGDLNGDGQIDLAISDTVEHFIEIASFQPPSTLEPALAFRVFEQKSFTDIDDLIEPRELALGDVDGDGRTDLVLLVHDRILVYRQDSGQPPAPSEKPESKTPSSEKPAENPN